MGVNITTIAHLEFNHRNWVNYYFKGGGSPGYIYILKYIYIYVHNMTLVASLENSCQGIPILFSSPPWLPRLGDPGGFNWVEHGPLEDVFPSENG